MTMQEETWRPVVGYEGYYEVSDQGRVRSVDRAVRYVDGRTYTYKGRIVKPSLNPRTGRWQVALNRQDTSKTFAIYRLVLPAFCGPRPSGMEICHNNGDRRDDRLSNLRWDTKSENRLDAVRHGSHSQTRKTQCPRGHLLVDPNLVPSRLVMADMQQRGRNCLACSRARSNVKRARDRGEHLDFRAVADDHYARIIDTEAAHDATRSGCS